MYFIVTLLFLIISLNVFAMTLHQAAKIGEQFGAGSCTFKEELANAPATETVKERNSWPMFTPSLVKNSNDLWVEGELLYWLSNVGSLDYGITSNSTTTINGHVKQPDFKWNWGFRLGLGYKLPHDRWDLFANYTYVYGKANGNASGIVFPQYATNFAGLSPFYATAAHAHWKTHINIADIELGRTCFAGKWLTIRPFLGVRGLFIDQQYNVSYQGGTVAPADTDKMKMDSDFWGVGIRMGFNSLWGLGKGISIYGDGSASLLSGHFDVHEKEQLVGIGTVKINTSRDVENVVVNADLGLGLQWDYLFSKDRYHFGVKVGWEFDLFFDQNQLFNFLSTNPGAFNCNHDDLSFQGVTLGFRLDF